MSAAPIPRWAAVALLLGMATVFGSNHVAARVAFEHGANVTTAVAVRSTGTAAVVFLLMLASGVSPRLPRVTLARALSIGLILSVQSYCLYSAVALIPVALALLAFQTFPMVLALLSWATGGERPSRRVAMAMPVALLGLTLALDVVGSAAQAAGRWSAIGPGVLFALGASLAFAAVLFLSTRWLGEVDGRVRSFYSMLVVSVVTLVAGTATGGFSLPADGTGWVALVLLTAFYGTAITSMFVLLPKLGTVNNAGILNFEPIAVLGIAWVVLGQAVTPLQALGAFIVVGAIMWMGSSRK